MSLFSARFRTVLRWALVVFFVFGALGNLIAPEPIRDDYQRWGFPAWFHFVTGTLELSTALTLALGARLAGTVLGCMVMTGAAATVALHGELLHAVAPLVVLALLLVNGRAPPTPAIALSRP